MILQTIYVTGANGFIGRQVVTRLSHDYLVVALLRRGSLPGFALNSRIRIVYGDLLDKNSLLRTIPEKSIIVNLAANPYHPKLSYKVNVGGVENLLAAAKVKQVKLFAQISSQATKIVTQGVYAITKNAGDKIVRQSGVSYVILKSSLVYGEGERGLFGKIKQLAKMLPVVPIFGDGQTKIYPIYVNDFVEIVAQAIQNPMAYQKVFDVGAEAPITYNTLYSELAPKVIHIPVWIGLLLAKACSFLPNPPIYRDNVLGSTQNTHCKPKPILKLLNFTPRTFAEGMIQVEGKDKVKIAVVGLGKMGTLHLAILNTFQNVEIVALVDTNKQLFQTIKSMGIAGNFYASLSEAFAKEKLEAVYILTPTMTHFSLMQEALEHGAHVFVEKPAFLNDDQLREMRKIKTDRIVQVGYTLLYGRIYQELKRILLSGKYGRVHGFSGKFEHGEVFGPKKGWMFNPQLSGGGVLMNPGPHFFSLIYWFFGKPTQVEAAITAKFVTKLDDQVRAKLRYADFGGEVRLNWGVKGRVTPLNYFNIQCERARITTDGRIIKVKPHGGRLVTISSTDIQSDKPVFDLNPRANGEAYYEENRTFVEAITGVRSEVTNTLKFAMGVESIIFEIYKRGKWR